MKVRLLEQLACPACRTSLTLAAESARASGECDISEGSLHCGSCGQAYPIHAGIPRFPAGAGDAEGDAVRRTRRTYDFTWSRFGAAEVEQEWEKDSYVYTDFIPRTIFEGPGKVGLDAGCGGGADLRRFWQRGLRVIGFDLSAGVDTIARAGGVPPQGDLVQGDLHALPFRSGAFDFVYSFGVLHHLPEPALGLSALADALKPGAPLVTYLYERFDDRSAWARALLDLVACVRRVTSRLPPRVLHALCWLMVPFVWTMFALPARLLQFAGASAADRVPFSHTVRWPVLAADLYDRFAPPVEHRFTEARIRELYARCGLERVEVRRYHGWVSWGYRAASSDSGATPRGHA